MSESDNEQEDQWYAQLDTGEVRLMTLEQLDEVSAPAYAAATAAPPSIPSLSPVVQDVPVWDLETAPFKPRRTGSPRRRLRSYWSASASRSAPPRPIQKRHEPWSRGRTAHPGAQGVIQPVTGSTPLATGATEERKASTDRFSDEMKEKLLAADKEREKQRAAQRTSRPGSPSRSGVKRSGNMFTKGGSAYDPMNGQL